MAEFNEDESQPIAPLSLTTRSDQPYEDPYHHDPTKHLHPPTKRILCCGLIASLAIIVAFIFIVLSLTVFHLHNPKLTVDSISFIHPLDFVNGQVNTTQNATVLVEISLSNPNSASFRMNTATVSVHYGKLVVDGDSSRRSGTIPAKQTVKMNLTAEIVTTKLLASVPGLTKDLNRRGVDFSVLVTGKVKIVKIFKKSVHLIKDCSMEMTMNSSSQPTFHCLKTRNGYEHIPI